MCSSDLDELGDVVFVDLPAVGSSLEQFKVFGAIESVKAVSDLYSPISGSIVAKNDALSGDPARINADPYGDGWLLEVEISSAQELDALFDAAGYRLHIG